jgi:hypothetical protein
MVNEPEPGTAPTLPILCPECKDRLPDQRTLSIHLERHREVKPPVTDPRTGAVVSKACSMGCGRHFLRPSEYREHNPLCDGSAPLWKPPLETVQQVIQEVGQSERARKRRRPTRRKPMVKCEECGKKFRDGRGLAGHRRSGCGDSKAPKATTAADGKLGDILREKAESLRAKAAALTEAADKLEATAGELDNLSA